MIITGLGTGTLITSLRPTLQAAVTDEETTNAVPTCSSLHDIGMMLGVALGGSIFHNAVLSDLSGASAVISQNRAADIAHNAASLVPLSTSFPDSHERQVVQAAHSTGFRTTAVVMCCFSTAALILSFFMASFSLRRNAESRGQSEAAGNFAADQKSSSSLTATDYAESEIRRPESALISLTIDDLAQNRILHSIDLR